ncbi:Hypp7963 [Branchiostoma lanceolatum]|uniref:Hypp7963 protein n=1 Tax=Branchiostoma lanceolatum TaxID=7740 RepID=A0A8K0EGI2_BRALA|nr:Hypp7963 [Branchiostoma lanceolatum]
MLIAGLQGRTGLLNDSLREDIDWFLKENVTNNGTLHDEPYGISVDPNAFIYIIVVLLFYVVSLSILMVQYVRGEKEDIDLMHYYENFVKRESFQDRFRVRDFTRDRKGNRIIARDWEKFGPCSLV